MRPRELWLTSLTSSQWTLTIVFPWSPIGKKEDIEGIITSTIEETNTYCITQYLSDARKVSVKYRDGKSVVSVCDLRSEASKRVWAWAKSRLAGFGLIPLSFEEALLPVEVETDVQNHSPPEIVRDLNYARMLLNAHLGTRGDIQCVEDIVIFADEVKQGWSPRDPNLDIELGWVLQAGATSGVAAFHAKMRSCFPDATTHYKLDQTPCTLR